MNQETSSDMQRHSAFRKLEATETDLGSFDPSGFGATNEMMQVINSQNILIMKLLQRQSVLYHQLNNKFSSSDSGSGPLTHQVGLTLPPYTYDQYPDQNISGSDSAHEDVLAPTPIQQVQQVSIIAPKTFKKSRFSCEIVSSAEEAPVERKKQTETKNMVKNFSKAIFNFIRKNKEWRIKVLSHLGLEDSEFMKCYEQHKGRIHSISELRALWTSTGNIWHQAYRIMSQEYLRKHCLQKTFNSRVENYPVHLKYRKRLLEGLRCPQQFTALKID